MSLGKLTLRRVEPGDHDALWDILRPAFRAGDTYTIDPDISRADALAYWTGASHGAWLALDNGQPLGSYFLKTNQQGGGAHVCNCGFVTAPDAGGKGVARTMLDHALTTARTAGFAAMQFNFVVATNTRAVALWHRAGFETVGRLPGAFRHPELGIVDALVMYRPL